MLTIIGHEILTNSPICLYFYEINDLPYFAEAIYEPRPDSKSTLSQIESSSSFILNFGVEQSNHIKINVIN